MEKIDKWAQESLDAMQRKHNARICKVMDTATARCIAMQSDYDAKVSRYMEWLDGVKSNMATKPAKALKAPKVTTTTAELLDRLARYADPSEWPGDTRWAWGILETHVAAMPDINLRRALNGWFVFGDVDRMHSLRRGYLRTDQRAAFVCRCLAHVARNDKSYLIEMHGSDIGKWFVG